MAEGDLPQRGPDEVYIRVRPDGSYKVYGPVRMFDVDDVEYDLEPRRKADKVGDRIKLCRCGRSKTQPFCDESHKDCGFGSRPRVSDP
jgi:CDGSH-type Zn-finger protein